MLFVQLRFFEFLAGVLVLHWGVLRSQEARKRLLLVSSYVFYAAWDWRFCSLIALSTLIDHYVALALSRTDVATTRKRLLGISVAANLGMLGTFKYAGFFLESFQDATNALGLPVSDTTLELTLPVGISFYTFQTLSYTVDVYRGRLEARQSIVDTATFVAFFPQLVAGPIVRAKHFMGQLDIAHRLADVRWRAAIGLMVAGFVKKAIVADTLAVEVDRLFDAPELFGPIGALLGIVMYAAQIYCDFSGYSDMAIGIAMLFGYSLGVNFDFPYLATSLTDFWRRWHISLSNWLRDYVLLALPGNRTSVWAHRRNIFVTMLLGGLWHGAAWTFVVWGGLNGAWLVAERMWHDATTARRRAERAGRSADSAPQGASVATRPRRKTSSRALRPAQRVATFGGVCLLLVIFRAPDFDTAVDVFGRLLAFGDGGGRPPVESVVLLGVAAALHLFTWTGARKRLIDPLSDMTYAAGLGVIVAVSVAMLPVAARPFVYFQF